VGKLTDKVILITGCSSGIGVETARALHATGAHLFLTVRDTKKGEDVIKDILSKNNSNGSSKGKIELLNLELDSLQSVRDCVADFHSKSKQLNVLINNAGVMCCAEGQTKDGFETQFGTNHLGHFLLFQLLKPTLLSSSTASFNSRVVSVTSAGHRRSPILFDDLDLKKDGYDPWKSYGQSKTANIYLANEIERRYGSKGLHATSVHPGVIETELGRHLDSEFKTKIFTEMKLKLKSVEQGAATTVWAAIGKEWEGKGGKYLENCSVSVPVKDEEALLPGVAGHAKWVYDEEAAKKLWEVSLKLVGLTDETAEK